VSRWMDCLPRVCSGAGDPDIVGTDDRADESPLLRSAE
jgi:hypothetical protein